MKARPDHRYFEVKDAPEDHEWNDPLMAALAKLLKTGSSELSDVVYAYDLYKDTTHRAVLDAFVLSRMPLEHASRALEVPMSVLEAYCYLFMNLKAFRNKLELISYSMEYGGSDYGRELVRTAVSIGPDYLLWSFGDKGTQIDTRHIVKRTMMDSFFRSMAHKGNSLTSGVAKEAKSWMATAVKNAELLEKLEPQTAKNAVDELRIALETRDDTLPAEQAPVALNEILH
jgi:hypothetical protein